MDDIFEHFSIDHCFFAMFCNHILGESVKVTSTKKKGYEQGLQGYGKEMWAGKKMKLREHPQGACLFLCFIPEGREIPRMIF